MLKINIFCTILKLEFFLANCYTINTFESSHLISSHQTPLDTLVIPKWLGGHRLRPTTLAMMPPLPCHYHVITLRRPESSASQADIPANIIISSGITKPVNPAHQRERDWHFPKLTIYTNSWFKGCALCTVSKLQIVNQYSVELSLSERMVLEGLICGQHAA